MLYGLFLVFSLIQQAQKFFLDANESSDARNVCLCYIFIYFFVSSCHYPLDVSIMFLCQSTAEIVIFVVF